MKYNNNNNYLIERAFNDTIMRTQIIYRKNYELEAREKQKNH